MIENEEAARNGVAKCRSPPGGTRRGSLHVVSRASQYGLDASFMDRCEEELFIICQLGASFQILSRDQAASGHSLEEDMVSISGLLSRLPTDVNAHVTLSTRSSPSRAESEDGELRLRQKFLVKLKGLFFYATPHHGTRLAESNTVYEKGILFEQSALLNPEAARRNDEFRRLRKKNRWRTYGIGETVQVTLGRFRGLIVQEASARWDVDGFYTATETDHFNVSRPKSTIASNYKLLVDFIADVMEEVEVQTQDADPVHKIYTGLPAHPVGLTTRANEVQTLLKDGPVLGIFGMGGIGKTTLVREVFNNMSKEFEYTCFVDTVKGFAINVLEKAVLENFHHKGVKLDGALSEWSRMKGVKALVAMDDVDSVDQLRVLPPWQHFGAGSCLIITSRDQGVFKFYENCRVYELEFLDTNEAMELFSTHAFGSDRIPPGNSEQLAPHVKSVVGKCGGLPLSLEIMGRSLRNETSETVWEDAIDDLQRAMSVEGIQNEHDKLWTTFEVSYKKLSKEVQDMFCDAATFFFEERLDVALAAWNNRKADRTWKHLVDRAMVKEVIVREDAPKDQYKVVWVHEQLRDLAKKLVNNTMLQSTHDDDVETLVDELNAEKVNANTKSLRLRTEYPDTTLAVDSLAWLQYLKYVDIHGVHPAYEGRGLPGKLHLLRWDSGSEMLRPYPSFQINLIKMTDLAVLQLRGWVIPKDFLETLGNPQNLRILDLNHCIVPEGFGEALVKFPNLHTLSLKYVTEQLPSSQENASQLDWLQRPVKLVSLTLLGQLTCLKDLTIRSYEIETLPSSLGSLKSLQNVRLYCPRLKRLPDSFGRLSSLEALTLWDCTNLESVSTDFGHLSSLQDLSIKSSKLRTLPDSFHTLISIRYLDLNCSELERMPDHFGRLISLEDLTIRSNKLKSLSDSFADLQCVRQLRLYCPRLERLPDGFGRLCSLAELTMNCSQLKSLSNDFGLLATLRHLAIESQKLENLWDSSGDLQCVRELELYCPQLERLPNGFGRLCSLVGLTVYCLQLRSLSNDFGKLATLRDLTIWSEVLESLPDSFGYLQSVRLLRLNCPKLERLPDGFGRLYSIAELTMNCSQLRSLSNDFGQLATLRDLKIESLELESLPDSFGDLQSVQQLGLNCPKLERLPDGFGRLCLLADLRLYCRKLARLPAGFGRLCSLAKLTMNCRQLKSLSNDFGKLATLRDLEIVSLRLESLPDSFGDLQSVRQLRLDCPKLKTLPELFGRLCSLEELTLNGHQVEIPSNRSHELGNRSHELECLPDRKWRYIN